jgi:hypothetical protein
MASEQCAPFEVLLERTGLNAEQTSSLQLHAGMYTHASASKMSTMEWIRIHMPSQDQDMTASFCNWLSSRHVVRHDASACEPDHARQTKCFGRVGIIPRSENADPGNAFCVSCGVRLHQPCDVS